MAHRWVPGGFRRCHDFQSVSGDSREDIIMVSVELQGDSWEFQELPSSITPLINFTLIHGISLQVFSLSKNLLLDLLLINCFIHST